MNNSFLQSFKSLKANWSRTLLSSLGIMIGIASITVVLATSDAFEKFMNDQLAVFGDDWIDIEIKHPMSSEVLGMNIKSLKNEDAEAIFRLENIKAGYYILMTTGILNYEGEMKSVNGWAVSPGFPEVDKGELALGRFFDKAENDSAAKVMIIGKKIRERFFGSEDPIGKIIKYNKINFKIIGVYKERGNIGGIYDMDEMIYIPVITEQKVVSGVDHIQAIIAQARDKTKIGRTADDIRYLLQERHEVYTPEDEDFRVITMQESMDIINVILNGVKLLLLAIVGISVVVGGVGIMNVMYVSVVERTFEIGLRKSVGAKKGSILSQFLIESMAITLLGGVIGVLFAMLLSYIITYILIKFGVILDIKVTFESVIISTLFSMAVGIIFGVYPAKKAANLDPIVALRKR